MVRIVFGPDGFWAYNYQISIDIIEMQLADIEKRETFFLQAGRRQLTQLSLSFEFFSAFLHA